MTRDHRSPPSEDGLSIDRLLFDMIRDLMDRADDNQHLLGKMSAQVSMALEGIGSLEAHVMHLSKQGIGHTERLRRLEVGAVGKKEDTLWTATLELFGRKQQVVLLVLAILVVLGVVEPLAVKTYVLGVIGVVPN